ncbi:pyridoxamine 5'-phosphate oxidase family protein [Halalkalibacter nanhaiisediminis]|uniref:Pyridoxamine 5'-phosphate oxidase n=1 Tax=Halalkalibacter nanhaiisediminis TaxID=688079 RepID=A0A562QIE4_9BACI|nr:pyridoxamine 5'-phosphate oxidase family protein [Halalkalibacter nanhaiisediminis]TWI55826.1 pyridoxamine 5'-phosphate oxidase [Halalkalibacter nanhaiisediminis]
MANQVEQGLTEDLFPLLQKERYVTIATVDYEKKTPNVNAISWVFALNMKTIRFAIDNRSRIIENIKANNGVVLTMIANGSTYSIAGDTKIIAEKMEGVPLKLALIEMAVNEVRDVMFYGAKLINEPIYDKTYDAEAAAKLDRQVMDAMKKV